MDASDFEKPSNEGAVSLMFKSSACGIQVTENP